MRKEIMLVFCFNLQHRDGNGRCVCRKKLQRYVVETDQSVARRARYQMTSFSLFPDKTTYFEKRNLLQDDVVCVAFPIVTTIALELLSSIRGE